MSADNVTPIDEQEGAEPQWYVTLPQSPEILVFVTRIREYDSRTNTDIETGTVELRYDGWLEELLAAAIITEAMVVPPGKGHHYCDADGRSVGISRRWVEKEGQPRRYLVVKRAIRVGELPAWPSASKALAAHDRHDEWLRMRYPKHYGYMAPAAEPTRSSLHLIVGNTRTVH